jgi:hypothetical protein
MLTEAEMAMRMNKTLARLDKDIDRLVEKFTHIKDKVPATDDTELISEYLNELMEVNGELSVVYTTTYLIRRKVACQLSIKILELAGINKRNLLSQLDNDLSHLKNILYPVAEQMRCTRELFNFVARREELSENA